MVFEANSFSFMMIVMSPLCIIWRLSR